MSERAVSDKSVSGQTVSEEAVVSEVHAPPRRAYVPSRRARRIRTALQVTAFVLGVAALLSGGNALCRYGAESLIARNVRSATGVPVRPTVVATGPFVLPSALTGRYPEVWVRTESIASGPLRVDRIDSQLTDVRLPLRDVLLQDSRRFGVGSTRETIYLTYSDLNAYFAGTGRPLYLRRALNGTLTITGSVIVLGRTVTTTAVVGLSVSDASLVVAPTKITEGQDRLDGVGRLLLAQRLTLRVPLSTLPFGHTLQAVSAEPRQIRLEAAGRGVVVQP